MKKLWVSLLIGAALTVSAGAADIGTIDNGYPGDTEAQAQMLCDLGLFRGTENGFELEKPMTRAEAAAMLTRFLGAEQEALAGEWEHPFTDVPQWAEPYVGWLYESGLTKGVSDTVYGAEENVTCGQYCTFLIRASRDSDEYLGIIASQDEVTSCDTAGFLRGDAVSLAARALDIRYYLYDDGNGWNMAQKLIHEGVFTEEQLITAAAGVLPYDYTIEAGQGDEPNLVCCMVADVTVAKKELPDESYQLVTCGDSNRTYIVLGEEGQAETLYRIDLIQPDQIDLSALYTVEPTEWVFGLCSVDSTDYMKLYREDETAVLMLSGDSAQVTEASGEDCFPWLDGYIMLTDTQGWKLRESGVEPVAACGKYVTQMPDGTLVTQKITPEETMICTWNTDAEQVDAITVPNNVLAYPNPDEDTRVAYAPSLEQSNDVYLWGSAGLYQEQDGLLTQITARPAYDYSYSAANGSYVIVTHAPGRFVEYSESAMSQRTGDTLVRILPDGTTEPLLPELPEGSLLIDTVNILPDGRVEFTTMKATEPRRMGRFTCILENGKVTITDATYDITMIWGEDALAKEQARLDELGVGVNS